MVAYLSVWPTPPQFLLRSFCTN